MGLTRRNIQCGGERPSCRACISISLRCEYESDHRRRKNVMHTHMQDYISQKEDLLYILNSITYGSRGDADEIVHMIRSNENEDFGYISKTIQKLKETSFSGSLVESPSQGMIESQRQLKTWVNNRPERRTDSSGSLDYSDQ